MNERKKIFNETEGGEMNKTLKSLIVLKFGTQDDFAKQIGVSRSVISNVVQERRELSFEQKIKWAVVLGCDVNEIFPDDLEISGKDYRNTQNKGDSLSNEKEETNGFYLC
jgi:DNA-binding XRE family transcriptional regulator